MLGRSPNGTRFVLVALSRDFFLTRVRVACPPPSSLCNLYNWRYKHLGNLPHVQQLPEFQVPNPGLTFDFQLINVEDFNGVGESEPNPYFYQVS